MFGFLRKLFRRPEPPKEYIDGIYKIAHKRGMEPLPCCGKMRRTHVTFRSGIQLCPLENENPDLRYNPLDNDEEFEPSWSEPHFSCQTCGCKRGVHRLRGWKRTTCTDPDCPGCPTGCT